MIRADRGGAGAVLGVGRASGVLVSGNACLGIPILGQWVGGFESSENTDETKEKEVKPRMNTKAHE